MIYKLFLNDAAAQMIDMTTCNFGLKPLTTTNLSEIRQGFLVENRDVIFGTFWEVALTLNKKTGAPSKEIINRFFLQQPFFRQSLSPLDYNFLGITTREGFFLLVLIV